MKESKTKKSNGYKEVITYGNFPYKLPITDSRGITKEVEFVATLVESVPDHKECSICKKFLAKAEILMAPNIVNCKHEKFTETKINERTINYKNMSSSKCCLKLKSECGQLLYKYPLNTS